MVRVGGDSGMPILIADPNADTSRRFVEIAQQVAAHERELAHVRSDQERDLPVVVDVEPLQGAERHLVGDLDPAARAERRLEPEQPPVAREGHDAQLGVVPRARGRDRAGQAQRQRPLGEDRRQAVVARERQRRAPARGQQRVEVERRLGERLLPARRARAQPVAPVARDRGHEQGRVGRDLGQGAAQLGVVERVLVRHDDAVAVAPGDEVAQQRPRVRRRVEGLEVREQPLARGQVDLDQRALAPAERLHGRVAGAGGDGQPDGRREHARHAPQAHAGVEQHGATALGPARRRLAAQVQGLARGHAHGERELILILAHNHLPMAGCHRKKGNVTFTVYPPDSFYKGRVGEAFVKGEIHLSFLVTTCICSVYTWYCLRRNSKRHAGGNIYLRCERSRLRGKQQQRRFHQLA